MTMMAGVEAEKRVPLVKLVGVKATSAVFTTAWVGWWFDGEGR